MKDQYIHIDPFGNKRYYSNTEMTVLHREDGPAVENEDGYKAWYLNGDHHRKDGPAVECANGDRHWYLHGRLHRDDGPAVECNNGDKFWYREGELHREDGPAIECRNGYKIWYLNDIRHTEDEFNAKMNPPVELSLDQIAEKFGIDINRLKIRK